MLSPLSLFRALFFFARSLRWKIHALAHPRVVARDVVARRTILFRPLTRSMALLFFLLSLSLALSQTIFGELANRLVFGAGSFCDHFSLSQKRTHAGVANHILVGQPAVLVRIEELHRGGLHRGANIFVGHILDGAATAPLAVRLFAYGLREQMGIPVRILGVAQISCTGTSAIKYEVPLRPRS